MSSGVAELSLILVQLALNIALPAWIVRRDLSRLGPAELARSWPDASLWIAVVLFGPLCLPVHALKSRRSLRGIGLGLIWLAAALAAGVVAAAGVQACLGWAGIRPDSGPGPE